MEPSTERKPSDERKIEIVEIMRILGTEGGRKFMFDFLESTGKDGDIFDADPYVHSRNSGRRSVGIQLEEQLKSAAPDLFMIMLKENYNGR